MFLFLVGLYEIVLVFSTKLQYFYDYGSTVTLAQAY